MNKMIIRKSKIIALTLLTYFIVVSFVISGLTIKGASNEIIFYPKDNYQYFEVESKARDKLSVKGWLLKNDTSEKLVIISHGWSGNRSTLIPLALYLQNAGFNVITFSYRGETGQNSYGLYEKLDLQAILEFANENNFSNANISLIGHSMGGIPVAHMANEIELDKIIFVSSVINTFESKLKFSQDISTFAPTLLNSFVTFFERFYHGISIYSPHQVIPYINEPTLIMHGYQDEKSSIDEVNRIKDLKLDNISFYLVDGDHNVFLRNVDQIKLYKEKIEEFLNEQEA